MSKEFEPKDVSERKWGACSDKTGSRQADRGRQEKTMAVVFSFLCRYETYYTGELVRRRKRLLMRLFDDNDSGEPLLKTAKGL